MYYGIDWNWSGIAIIGIGIGFCTGFGIELELILPELELNCKDGIDPDLDQIGTFYFLNSFVRKMIAILKNAGYLGFLIGQSGRFDKLRQPTQKGTRARCYAIIGDLSPFASLLIF